MADFDLQQTDQQVQNILNDGQSAMGAGAQTTLTTEYIMLKDVNGVYHKILKDSLTEACRNVLAGLLVNNDKGTTINQIAAIASGDLGSVTPANLASVLGVYFKRFSEGDSIDFNNLAFEQTIIAGYYNGSSCQNCPVQNSDGMILAINKNEGSGVYLQLIFASAEYGNSLWVKQRWGTVIKEWVRIY